MSRVVNLRHIPDPRKIERNYNRKYVLSISMNLQKLLNDYKKPASTVTYGAEIEFCIDDNNPRLPGARDVVDSLQLNMLMRRLQFHNDYGVIYEISLPPFSIPPRKSDLMIAHYAEELTGIIGARVSYCIGYDDERSASQHFHVRSTNFQLLARMANWLIATIPIIKFIGSMPYYVKYFYRGRVEYHYFGREKTDSAVFRPMVSHYSKKPYYISAATIQELENTNVNTRGYDPEPANFFYAIELNKYRKNIVTLENRLTENHVLSSIFLTELFFNLSQKYPHPLADATMLYNDHVRHPIPITVDSIVQYDKYLMKDHPLIEKREYRMIDLLELLIDRVYDNLSDISTIIADYIKSRKRRPTYFHYRKFLIDYLNL